MTAHRRVAAGALAVCPTCLKNGSELKPFDGNCPAAWAHRFVGEPRVASGGLLMDAILDALNSAFAADPAAVHSLCANRVPCNQALADHPTVQVAVIQALEQHPAFCVGALGLINGVVEAATGQRVASSWSDDERQPKMLGFVSYTGGNTGGEA